MMAISNPPIAYPTPMPATTPAVNPEDLVEARFVGELAGVVDAELVGVEACWVEITDSELAVEELSR